MREMDTYESATEKLARDPGLYQLVVKDVHATALRAALPPEWSRTALEAADGFPEPGVRFTHEPRQRVLATALDGRWHLLTPDEQVYAGSRIGR